MWMLKFATIQWTIDLMSKVCESKEKAAFCEAKLYLNLELILVWCEVTDGQNHSSYLRCYSTAHNIMSCKYV